MPETTINGRNFENETERKLYQEALDMVNGNESDIHEDTLRSIVSRHNNEDIFREASNLAHTLGFKNYEAELNEQYTFINELKVVSAQGQAAVIKALLNDRDKTKELSHEEHINRYKSALAYAGFTDEQIRSIMEEYQMLNPSYSMSDENQEEMVEEKPVVVKDEDNNKKKVGISEENVMQLSKKVSQTKLEEAELLLRTVRGSNKRIKKRTVKWNDLSQLNKSQKTQDNWGKLLKELEQQIEGMNPSQKDVYVATIEKIKEQIDENKGLLNAIAVREFGKQPDGSYKGGRIETKRENQLGIKSIKLNILSWPRRQLRKIWYKLSGKEETLEQQDIAAIESAANELSEIEKEQKEVISKINTVSRYCIKITNMGIKIQHTTLEEMQKYYEDATELMQSINGCSDEVKKTIGDRIERINTQYNEMKEQYSKYIQENVAVVETELNKLHASIGDDQEHDMKKEQDMLSLVQKLYPACSMVMDDAQKEQMSSSIAKAEAELNNKAIYLKYKELFERTSGLSHLNPEMASNKIDSILEQLKNESFKEAVKYNKDDLIAFFENEKNKMFHIQGEKKETTQKDAKVTLVEPYQEKKATEKVNVTPQFVIDKQTQTIFTRQKKQIDELEKSNQEKDEIIANLQRQLAEAKAKETLQTQKKEAKDTMMSTVADIKKEARELGTQKTHLEWEINSLRNGLDYLDEIKKMPMVQNELSKISDEREKTERLHQLAEGYAEKKNKAQIEEKEKELSKVAEKLQNLDNQINEFSANYQTMVSDVDEIKRKADEDRQQKIDDFGNELKSFEQQKIDAQKKALEEARVNIDDLFASMEENEKGKSL